MVCQFVRVAGARGRHGEKGHFVRRNGSVRQPGFVVRVVQPPVPLPRDAGGVVVVEVRVLHPPVPAALVGQVLEVLVAVGISTDQGSFARL